MLGVNPAEQNRVAAGWILAAGGWLIGTLFVILGGLMFLGPRLCTWIPVATFSSAEDVAALEALLHSKVAELWIMESVGSPVGGGAQPA
jgi:hypothetical protein